MYLHYWKLTEKPFENTPDPRFMYYSKTHKSALINLMYAVTEMKSGAMLWGEAGCGKTLIARTMIQKLNPSKFQIALPSNTLLDEDEFLREIVYQFGINSSSFKNFQSRAEVPVFPLAIYFTTKGAGDEVKQKLIKPRVIKLDPPDNAKDVNPDKNEISVTFNIPMGKGMSWTGSGPNFPTLRKGQKAQWTKDGKTCVLPVKLEPNWYYILGINSRSHINFQSESGVPSDPVTYSFKTRGAD